MVNQFRSRVLEGDFSNLYNQIHTLKVNQEQARIIEFQLSEQRYLELVEKGQKMEAIQVL